MSRRAVLRAPVADRRARRLAACLVLLGATIGRSPVIAAAAGPEPKAQAQFIVRVSPTIDGAAAAASAGRATATELSFVRRMGTGADVWRTTQPLTTAESDRVLAHLRTLPGVVSAVPDERRQVLRTPNDPFYATRQWNLSDPVGGIDAPTAWDVTTGDPGLVVAVIDTGVLGDHPDLPSARILPGYDFITDAFVGNDGDGRDANASDPGDWVTAAEAAPGAPCDGSPTMSSSWHGTSVAGLIAAEGDNGLFIAGVAWGVRILPVRVMGKCGGFDSDIIDGMLWAAGLPVAGAPANPNPARVLNLSLGGGGTPCSATAYPAAIAQILAAGAVIVAAAGNDGGPVNTPANCAGVIAVGASTRPGDLSSFSSLGGEMTLAAPGGELGGDPILALSNTGTTTPLSPTWRLTVGTSDAAPQVSGAAALILSVNPTLPPDQVADRLASTARPYAPGSQCLTALFGQCGAGRLDVGAAVSATLAALPTIAQLTPAGADPGAPDLTLTVSGHNFVDGSVVTWNGAPLTTTYVDAAHLTVTLPAGALTTVGQAQVRVANPDPGGTSYYPALFVIGSRLYLPDLQRAP